jgi:FAD:protein FMN transferase
MIECRRAGEAMGSLFEVFLRGDDAEHLEAVALAVLDEVRRLERLLSRYDPRSEISRINREAWKGAVRVDGEVFALLERSERGRRETGGCFDIAPGLELCFDAPRVGLSGVGVGIDPGGIGKGYALDVCGRILRRFNIGSGLIHGGTSSILAIGGDEWPIDLRNPESVELPPVGRLWLRDGAFSCSAVVSSGSQESGIIDPLTGQRVVGTAACYVLAPEATEAEILSTGLLVMGRARAADFLSRYRAVDRRVGWYEPARGLCWILQ